MLQGGRIIEDGPPNRLMQGKGPYRELVAREMSRLPCGLGVRDCSELHTVTGNALKANRLRSSNGNRSYHANDDS